MSQMLSEEQQKLVEENHNLIYSFLKSRKLSLDAVEDWYGAAAIGLCKAAIAYDKKRKAKFTTFAYLAMETEVRQVMRRNRKCIVPVTSLNEPIADGLSLEDILEDNMTLSTLYS